MSWRGALVERGGELEALDAALERAAAEGGVLLIEGPAGIGKSRLVEALTERAAGFEVLTSRGGALEGDIAFGVVRQLFEHRLARADSAEREQLLSGAAARVTTALGLEEADIEGSLAASLHALFWLVENFAERRPLLLAIDDIHWSDRASLEFLVYLARRLEGLPVLVVAAARDGEPRAHEAVIKELAAHATTLRPAPLSAHGVGEMVRMEFGAAVSSDFVEACVTATGGNPFYLGELLAALTSVDGDPTALSIDAVRSTVPSTVARSILLRLGRLPDPAPRLAVAASVLGDGASLRHAAALANVAPGAAEPAADALVQASILADVHPLRFAHPIVRAAIADDSPPAERAAAHRRAALLLNAEDEPADRLVPHLLQSAPAAEQWVADVLHEAARAATTRGAPDVAVRLLRRALDERPPSGQVELLGDLCAVELAAGDYHESAMTAGRAIDAAQQAATRARMRIRQATALLSVQGAPPALRCLEDGIREASEGDPQVALLLEGELAMQAWFADVPHPVTHGLARHRDLPGNTYAERVILSLIALEALRGGEPAAAIRKFALRALGDGALIAEGTVQAMAYYTASCALIEAEAYDEAREAITAGMADVQRRGAEYGYAGVCWMRGMLATREGDLAAAEADERTCAEHAVPTMVGIGASALALALLEQGDADAAHQQLERAGLLGDFRPLYVWGPYIRGLVRMARGQAAEALADFDDVGRHTTEVGGATGGLPWRAQRALALHALGEQEAAEAAAEAELEFARRRGTPRALGIALRARGAVASGERRVEFLSDAVDALGPSRAKLELARARGDLGVSLARAGRRRDGRRLLELSHDTARACGARGLARITHEELKVAGARPRRLMFSGVESLTAGERRVAEMAADGLTNREIAEALFVTPKTVENQLGHVYGKLGVSSRRALPQTLGRAKT